MTRVAIVGAGPAGLFAAYELAQQCIDVIVLDMGKDVAERKRDSAFDLLHGMGGSGTFSDGKINFHPQVGGNLSDFLMPHEAWQLMEYIEGLFGRYGVGVICTDDLQTRELEKRAAKAGVMFLPIRQAHIGSDHLTQLIRDMSKDLRQMGVQFELNARVADVALAGPSLRGVILDNGRVIEADAVILAPGRVGSEWMRQVAQEHGLAISYSPVDIGVRVEVPAIVMEEVINVCYDPKFYVRAPTYDDRVRTFCVSPQGFVVQETYQDEGAVGVNGHALRDRKTGNTNFALLTSINLTEPVESTTAYGLSIAKLATTIGGGKPILQSLAIYADTGARPGAA